MNTLPLDCLVDNFLACEGRTPPIPDEAGIYSVPIDDTHWLGVQQSSSGASLMFFANPGAKAATHGAGRGSEDDEGRIDSQQQAEPEELLELGIDADGSWMLSTDRLRGRHVLWIRIDRESMGHAEFARVVGNLRWRFALWDRVLNVGNEGAA
ncbi:hypothetical protein [Variovorax sp. KK3]|uniref:hypothetical protein n=1 Tax=Variovorax sp. KK3 TaxID=1855728 RepID=UPI00097BBFA5|nr:hypothetical protein [Variovorax sp. KK3]